MEVRRKNLSNREREIMILMAEGLADREIAQKLNISARTVQTYNVRIYTKLRAKNKPHAVANFIRMRFKKEQSLKDTYL